MAELERKSSEFGAGPGVLMENAGRAVAEFVLSRYLGAKRVCVVCGSGNNGGDGLVVARHLAKRMEVTLILLTTPERIRTGEARANWERLAGTGVGVVVAADAEALKARKSLIAEVEVVVDAILGTGVVGGMVREPLATAIEMINSSRAAKVAVDLPSGLDPGTGEAGTPTVRADVTVALHRAKVGLLGNEMYTGEVVVVPIGIREGP